MVRSIVHPPAASATHPVEGRAQLVLAERSVLYMYVSGHGDKVRLEEEGALDGRPAQLLSHDVRVRLYGLQPVPSLAGQLGYTKSNVDRRGVKDGD